MSDGGGDTGGDFGDGGGGNNNNSNNNMNNDNWNGNQNDHYDDDRHYEYDSGGKKSPYMCYIIFGTIVAVLGFGLSGVLTDVSRSRLKTYDRVIGKIIGTSSCGESCSTNSNGNRSCSTTYAAIVEYEVDGGIYEFTTSSCSQPAPTIGNDFKVLYDPENPSEAVSGSFMALWLAPIVLCVLGLIGLCVCCAGCAKKGAQTKQDAEVTNDFSGGNAENGMNMNMHTNTNTNSAFQASPYGHTSASAPPMPAESAAPAPYVTQQHEVEADTTPTNPYVVHSQQQQNQSNGTASNGGAKPSLFDQLQSGTSKY